MRHLAFIPNGKYLAGSRRLPDNVNTATVWAAASGSEISRMRNEGDYHFWSSDGSRVFTNNHGKLKVWRASTGDFLCETSSSINGLTSGDISADGLRIVNCAETVVSVLDVRPIRERISIEHEAQNLVAGMLPFPLMQPPFTPARKLDLLARVRQLKTTSEPVRRLALKLVEDIYTDRERQAGVESLGRRAGLRSRLRGTQFMSINGN